LPNTCPIVKHFISAYSKHFQFEHRNSNEFSSLLDKTPQNEKEEVKEDDKNKNEGI